MKDCMEIFLSPETLAWGEGLKYLLDLFSYNQLSLSDLMRVGRSISSSLTTGSVCLGEWLPREKASH